MEVRYGQQYSSYGVLEREIRVADKIMAASVQLFGECQRSGKPFVSMLSAPRFLSADFQIFDKSAPPRDFTVFSINFSIIIIVSYKNITSYCH